ncbi:hypothetical protein [Peredibacter starrii]|uniref:Secreted protein n=1 Tax=Peredibacter starrii TaxID=28202 RepID=A0AAX4HNK6_9BACT|nr:hypothetical protein [Peredibacter starrii]WPU64785.1 hypothetical protein SOO65_19000 [Peredibacter starrii]
MRKKLIIITLIFVSIIVLKSMSGTTEKIDGQVNHSSLSVQSKPIDLGVDETKPVVNDDQSDFQDELDRHLKKLPTMGDLKNLTAEEVHHTPEIILEGGGLIGKVYDEAEREPKKRLDAMNFFKKCAVDQEIATSIRAMCLNKILSQVPLWNIPMSVTDAEISSEVFELAMKLPR